MKKKHANNKSSKACANQKCGNESKHQISVRNNTAFRMDTIIQCSSVLVIVLGLIAAVLATLHNHRDMALWTTCAAVFAAIFGLFAWLQDRAWKSDKDKNENTTPESSIAKSPPSGHEDLISELKELNNNDVGFLSPGTSTTPPIDGQIPDGSIAIFFGDTATSNSQFPHVVIAQAGEPMLTLGVESNRLWVSANFFSKDGEVIAKIVKNKVYVNKANMTYWMREQTDNRLTVFNKQNKIVIDVVYLNPSAVAILGDFYLRNGFPVIIEPHKVVLGTFEIRRSFYQENVVDFPIQ